MINILRAQHLFEMYPYSSRYSTQTKTQLKYCQISRRFAQRFGAQPQYFVKVPAKAMIFGHDSMHYQLQKIFICFERDVVVAFRKNGLQDISLHCVMSTVMADCKFSNKSKENKYIQGQQFKNLIRAGMKAGVAGESSIGLDMYVSFDFQKDKKLGFSTAVITAFALAFVQANNRSPEKLLKTLEQQASLVLPYKKQFSFEVYFSSKNHSLVSVSSQQIKAIQLDKKYHLIYLDQLIPRLKLNDNQLRKAVLRDCQVQIGLQIMAIKHGYEMSPWKNLVQMQRQLQIPLQAILQLVKQYLQNQTYKAQDISAITGIQLEKILAHIPYSNFALKENVTFEPFRPVLILTVQAFLAKKISNNQIGILEGIQKYKQLLGKYFQPVSVMSSVHHKKIGFSNFVYFQEKNHSDSLLKQLKESYFQKKQRQLYIDDQLDRMLFKSQASHGCAILNPQYQIWF